jgi:PAS domain S-box-containing protein
MGESNGGANDEARFRVLIDAAPDPIGISRGGKFIYANRMCATAFGYASPEALYGIPISTLLAPGEAPVLRHRQARLFTGSHEKSQIYRVKRPDGSEIEMEVTSVVLEYEGEPALVTIGRDVTERKALERKLVQADRLAAIGTMAAGVAHEINNPLAYVLLNLSLLARTLPEALRDSPRLDAVMNMLNDARHGVDHVATVVRDLTTFSRGDTETSAPVDLQAVALSAIKLSAYEVRRRATIQTTFEPAPLVFGNEARLEQVVLNLLINAAQAVLHENTSANVIRVRIAATDDNRVALEVEDNGSGIPAEVLPHIFDPFFTTKPVGVGTGLGLSICHGIVTSLGGTITATSATGRGTTFRVTLPVVGVDRHAAGAGDTDPDLTEPASATLPHEADSDTEAAVAE